MQPRSQHGEGQGGVHDAGSSKGGVNDIRCSILAGSGKRKGSCEATATLAVDRRRKPLSTAIEHRDVAPPCHAHARWARPPPRGYWQLKRRIRSASPETRRLGRYWWNMDGILDETLMPSRVPGPRIPLFPLVACKQVQERRLATSDMTGSCLGWESRPRARGGRMQPAAGAVRGSHRRAGGTG